MGRIAGLITMMMAAGAFGQGADLSGAWLGTLNAGAAELRLLVHLTLQNGAYAGTLDSIDQGAKDLPLDEVVVDGPKVAFSLSVAGGAFGGEYVEESDEIRGQWSQGGATIPLILRRTDGAPTLNRPQEPKPPFPYIVAEVGIDHLSEPDVHFEGTLTLPEGDGPFPAALLISGSGQQDRDESVFGHRPFLVLSDFLTRRGIAVLRVDDRGVGGSKGPLDDATTATFATDASSQLEFLRRQERIKSDEVGLIGHSEGGIIAAIVAADDSNVAFAVLLASPAVTGEEILLKQTELIARVNGMEEETLARTLELSQSIYDILGDAADIDAAETELRNFYENLAPEDQALVGVAPESRAAAVRQLTSPWFVSFLKYDPRADLQRLRSPTLAIYGEKDLQVPPEQNSEVMRQSLTAAPVQDFSVEVFPGLNHLFQTAETGSPMDYAKIEETMSPAVLEQVVTWILERFGS